MIVLLERGNVPPKILSVFLRNIVGMGEYVVYLVRKIQVV